MDRERKLELQQAVRYFSTAGFARLFAGMSERYRRLGRIGGSVRLEGLSGVERDALSGVLGRDLRKNNEITVGLAEFQAALDKTRFAGIDLLELLQGVTGQALLPIAAERQAFQEGKAGFFAGLREEHPHHRCCDWLGYVEANATASRSIHRAYSEDRERLREELGDVLLALSQLPADARQVKRLPVWATEITGKPHAFDLSTTRGGYLLHALGFLFALVNGEASPLVGAENQTALLESFGIVRDDLLNFVICGGLLASGSDDGLLQSWQAALAERSVMNLPVRELAKLRRVFPAVGKQVFVVENPGVFSDLLDNLSGQLPPLVCTFGQFNLACYLLLDKLAADGATINYSGDHDPEGLLMAERLRTRYGSQLRTWRFGRGDYLAAVSDEVISEPRLKQLDRVMTPELVEVAVELRRTGLAGYQERLLPLLLQDLLAWEKTLHKTENTDSN